MQLEEMFPKKSSFKLEATGNEYHLRPMTIGDNIWLNENYGNLLGQTQDLSNLDFNALTAVIYKLIVNKQDFKKKTMSDLDEEGNELEIEVGGLKLFRYFTNIKDMENMIWALNETMGISRPEVKEAPKKKREPKRKDWLGQYISHPLQRVWI